MGQLCGKRKATKEESKPTKEKRDLHVPILTEYYNFREFLKGEDRKRGTKDYIQMLDYFEIFKDVRDASTVVTLTDGQKKKLEENEFFLFKTTEVDKLDSESFIYNLQDIPQEKSEVISELLQMKEDESVRSDSALAGWLFDRVLTNLKTQLHNFRRR